MELEINISIMVEWREISDDEQHELVLDFARELHITSIEN